MDIKDLQGKSVELTNAISELKKFEADIASQNLPPEQAALIQEQFAKINNIDFSKVLTEVAKAAETLRTINAQV